MKVWIDACTGKQVRYACAIANRLRQRGYNLILTTRKHPDTSFLADILGEKFTVVGKYDPTSLFTRLHESVKRTLSFCELFRENTPDLVISHQSVEACRVAFGLGIPVISTADAPHAEAVNRLTLPLVNILITSRAIPQRCYRSYGIRRVVSFDGVDEVAWIKNYAPKLDEKEHEKPLIVVRQMETRAVYARKKNDVTEEIAQKLTTLGQVVFLSRYEKHPRRELIVPKKYVDSAALVGKADLVVSFGGTMAREAALQGTPSIVIPTLLKPELYYTNNYISKLGFPLFTVDPPEVLKFAKKYMGMKWEVKELIDKLENPTEVIVKIIEEGKYE